MFLGLLELEEAQLQEVAWCKFQQTMSNKTIGMAFGWALRALAISKWSQPLACVCSGPYNDEKSLFQVLDYTTYWI